jgi:hypothetical protein
MGASGMSDPRGENGGFLYFGAETAKENRALARAYYRQLGATKEWAENNYYHLRIAQQDGVTNIHRIGDVNRIVNAHSIVNVHSIVHNNIFTVNHVDSVFHSNTISNDSTLVFDLSNGFAHICANIIIITFTVSFNFKHSVKLAIFVNNCDFYIKCDDITYAVNNNNDNYNCNCDYNTICFRNNDSITHINSNWHANCHNNCQWEQYWKPHNHGICINNRVIHSIINSKCVTITLSAWLQQLSSVCLYQLCIRTSHGASGVTGRLWIDELFANYFATKPAFL